MSERNIEALQQLRRVVNDAPEDRLHMRMWCEKEKCGTAYCAAGWAAIDPWFQENTSILDIFDVDFTGFVRVRGLLPTDRLSEILGIDEDDGEALFAVGNGGELGPHDITKAEVLDNIDRLIAGDSAEVYDACYFDDDDDDDDFDS